MRSHIRAGINNNVRDPQRCNATVNPAHPVSITNCYTEPAREAVDDGESVINKLIHVPPPSPPLPRVLFSWRLHFALHRCELHARRRFSEFPSQRGGRKSRSPSLEPGERIKRWQRRRQRRKNEQKAKQRSARPTKSLGSSSCTPSRRASLSFETFLLACRAAFIPNRLYTYLPSVLNIRLRRFGL